VINQIHQKQATKPSLRGSERTDPLCTLLPRLRVYYVSVSLTTLCILPETTKHKPIRTRIIC
jgi:hypothetical protein